MQKIAQYFIEKTRLLEDRNDNFSVLKSSNFLSTFANTKLLIQILFWVRLAQHLDD